MTTRLGGSILAGSWFLKRFGRSRRVEVPVADCGVMGVSEEG